MSRRPAIAAPAAGALRNGDPARVPPRPATPVNRLVPVVLATALALAWPALLLNGAPLIFSDTMDFLAMGLGPERFLRARGYGWFAR